MKAFLIAFILVVACQAAKKFCNDPMAEYAPSAEFLKVAREKMGEVLSPCIVDGMTFEKFFFHKDTGCKSLLKEGYCYYYIADKRTDPVEGITYDQILNGIPDIVTLAKMACGNTCYEKVAPAVRACYADAGIRAQIVANLQGKFGVVKEMAEQYQVSIAGTPIGSILSMGLEKYASFDDLSSAVEANQDDLFAGYNEVKAKLGEFCDDECYTPTSKHIAGVVGAMNTGMCTDPAVFCGSCQNYATKYLKMKGSKKMPCCLKKLYDYATEKADSAKDRAENAGHNVLSALVDLGEKNEQYQCVREVYDFHSMKRNKKCMAAR